MKIWFCKIGESSSVPYGADGPMRTAVKRAYFELTGQEAHFVFSGWGATLTEGERAVVENRMPRSVDELSELREAVKEAHGALLSAARDLEASGLAHDHPSVAEPRAALARLTKWLPPEGAQCVCGHHSSSHGVDHPDYPHGCTVEGCGCREFRATPAQPPEEGK